MSGITLVTRNCEFCNAEFQVRPIIVAGGNGRYCGKQCFRDARIAKRPTLTCQQCQKTFTVKPHVTKDGRGRGRYCSMECMGAAYSEDRRPLADRFWEKVEKREGDGCWIWTGAKVPSGYGRIGTGGRDGKDVVTSRVSWELINGPIPEGLCVLHNCPDGDNPSCVRPDHLFLGTKAENSEDMVKKGRNRRGETVTTSKLTESQVIDIRRKYRDREADQSTLAREYGISGPTVSNIISRTTWKHVD